MTVLRESVGSGGIIARSTDCLNWSRRRDNSGSSAAASSFRSGSPAGSFSSACSSSRASFSRLVSFESTTQISASVPW